MMHRTLFFQLVLLVVSSHIASAEFHCDANVPAPAYLRQTSMTELAADILLTCDGDPPSNGITTDIDLFVNGAAVSTVTPPVILAGDEGPGWKLGENVFAAELVQGRVHWTHVPIVPAGSPRKGPFRFRLTNLRVNANSLAASSAPRANLVTASIIIGGMGAIDALKASSGRIVPGGVGGIYATYFLLVVGVLTSEPQKGELLGCDGKATPNTSFSRTRAANPGLLDGSAAGEQIQFMIHFAEDFESSFKPLSGGDNTVSLAEKPSESLTLTGVPGLRQADFGSRFIMCFGSVPVGVSIFATTEPMLAGMKRSDSIDGRLVGFDIFGAEPSKEIIPTGVARCGDVSLGVVEVPLKNRGGCAVWEITSADPNVLEEISFGVGIAYRPDAWGLPRGGTAKVNWTMGPVLMPHLLPHFASTAIMQNFFSIEMPAAPTVSTVNGASFSEGAPVAPDSIASVFGSHLAVPGNLSATSVNVKDSTGANLPATTLFYVSPSQVNFQVPANAANGMATITVTAADGTATNGTVQIASVAPGLFAYNSFGLYAGNILRVKADGTQSMENNYQMDANHNLFPLPVNLGSDQIFLIMYGTGIKRAAKVTATIANQPVPVAYYGAQGVFAGEDQVNIGPLPPTLAGTGRADIVITADGITANTVAGSEPWAVMGQPIPGR